MLELIKLLLDQEQYQKYREYIPKSHDSSVNTLYTLLDKLLDNVKRTVSFDEYRVFALSQIPYITKKDKDNYEIIESLLERVRISEVQPDAADAAINAIRKRHQASEFAIAALECSEGRRDFTDLQDYWDRLNIQSGPSEGFELTSDDLDDISDSVIGTGGLYHSLPCLNRCLGPLRKGDFGFIFARPEVGKTTWLCDESQHMFKQIGQDDCIAWANNEEESKKVKFRWIQSYFGINKHELQKNKDHYNKIFKQEVNGRFILPNQSLKHRKDIERLLETYKPRLLVIDALDAIEGFQSDREDLKLGAIFKWARELTKEYCPIIGTTWADATAENIKFLYMDHVTNAKTEKQKHADWIMGIGATRKEGHEKVRHLNISKNKLAGDENTEEELRHSKWDVYIEPDIARFRES